MKTFIFLLTACVIFNLGLAQILTDQIDDNHPHPENICNGENITMSAAFNKAKDDCLKEKLDAIKAGKSDRQKGLTCLALCEWKKIGVIDAAGKVNAPKAEEYFKSLKLSDSLTNKIKAGSDECFKKHSATNLVLDPKDKKCSNFKEFVKCEFHSVSKICDSTFDPEDWEF